MRRREGEKALPPRFPHLPHPVLPTENDKIERIIEGKPQLDLSDPFVRYLSILGVEAQPPSRRALGRLVRAHLMRVPFENISKLFLRKRQGATTIPSLDNLKRLFAEQRVTDYTEVAEEALAA